MYRNVALALFGILLVNQVNASCLGGCGFGPGEDVCSNSKSRCIPLVVRPQELPKPPTPTILVPSLPKAVPLGILPPIGGPCYCKVPLVKPAVIPKPACAQRRVIVNNNCAINSANSQQIVETYGGGCGVNGVVNGAVLGPVNGGVLGPVNGGVVGSTCGGSYLGPVGGPAVGPYGSVGPYGGVAPVAAPGQLAPADAVSVQIAYNQAMKAANTKEDILAFGFRQMPKEMPRTFKRTNNIKEENLYSMNGQVVELKPVQLSGKSVDEEAAEQLLDLQTEEEDVVAERGLRRLALGEIGYGPAKAPKNPLYVKIPSLSIEAPTPCLDKSYVPGSVLYTNNPKGETVQLPASLPEPCYDGDDSGNVNGYHYSSSHSSRSTCNSCNSNVIVKRTGCGCY